MNNKLITLYIWLLLITPTFTVGKITPYDIDKFKPILNITKLQAPLSKYNKIYSVKYGKFYKISHKYFFAQDDSFMTFYMCNKKHRSELRERDTWELPTKKKKTLTAIVKPISYDAKEFTFLQIHSLPTKDNKLNKPLLRMAVKGKILKAIIYHPKKYIKIDLDTYRDHCINQTTIYLSLNSSF